MFLTEPQVELLTTTDFNEKLIEQAGCLCYNSTPGKPEERIPKWIKSGHLSVIEHGRACLEFDDDTLQEHGYEVFNRHLYVTYRDTGDGYLNRIVSGNYRAWLELLQQWDDGDWLYRDIWMTLRAQAPNVFPALSATEDDQDNESYSTVVTLADLKSFGSYGSIPHIALHAAATFKISCSRAVSHEMVRHRMVSYSQRSQRYVDESNSSYYLPPEMGITDPHSGLCLSTIGMQYQFAINKAWHYYNVLRKDGVAPQIARYVLPNACLTEIIMTANLEEWHHIIKLRASRAAQPEMQVVAKKILIDLLREFPEVFDDLKELLDVPVPRQA